MPCLANRWTLPERKASPLIVSTTLEPEKKMLGRIAHCFRLPPDLNHLRWHGACVISLKYPCLRRRRLSQGKTIKALALTLESGKTTSVSGVYRCEHNGCSEKSFGYAWVKSCPLVHIVGKKRHSRWKKRSSTSRKILISKWHRATLISCQESNLPLATRFWVCLQGPRTRAGIQQEAANEP